MNRVAIRMGLYKYIVCWLFASSDSYHIVCHPSTSIEEASNKEKCGKMLHCIFQVATTEL